MLIFIIALVTALLSTMFIIRSSKVHAHLSSDDAGGPQKIHAKPVPRIGGVGIVAGVLLALGILWLRDASLGRFLGGVLLCAAPTFVGGLTEDITKNVSPGRRLLITAASALLAALFLDGVILRTGWELFDGLLAVPAIAIAVTIFAVVGVTNSVNIIDGFNGLASMCVMIMLLAVGYVAFVVGDWAVLSGCAICAGAVLGFFAWNYPGGMIFLGDGGAYFLGFMLAELSVLLLHRNPGISPMFPLLTCIYPVFETVFSIYRRRFIRKTSPGYPDGVHLHHLIFKRVMRWTVGRDDARALTRRNSMTSPYLWTLCLSSVTPAVLFWDNTPVLCGCIVAFAAGYVGLYWRIVRFHSPRWLVKKRPR